VSLHVRKLSATFLTVVGAVQFLLSRD